MTEVVRQSNYRVYDDAERALRNGVTADASTPVDSMAVVRCSEPTSGQWFWPGQNVELRVLFTNPDATGSPTDAFGNTIVAPTSVVGMVKDPSGAETAVTMTVNADGSFSGVVPSVQIAGTWWFSVTGSGNFAGAISSFFQVRSART